MSDASPTSNQHARTRDDHATELAEDYVEAIEELIRENGQCRVTDLANRFAVSHVTVNRTIGRLERDGLVGTEPYKPIELTKRGADLARRCRERHAVVLDFLLALGISEPVARVDAEGIEHHCSEETLQAMRALSAERNSATASDDD